MCLFLVKLFISYNSWCWVVHEHSVTWKQRYYKVIKMCSNLYNSDIVGMLLHSEIKISFTVKFMTWALFDKELIDLILWWTFAKSWILNLCFASQEVCLKMACCFNCAVIFIVMSLQRLKYFIITKCLLQGAKGHNFHQCASSINCACLMISTCWGHFEARVLRN